MTVSSVSTSSLDYLNKNTDVSSSSASQKPEKPSASEMVSKMKTDLVSKLNLTDEQQSSLDEILAQFTEDAEEAESSGDFSSMKSLMDELETSVKGILDEDQLSTYETMLSDMKSKMPANPPNQNGMNNMSVNEQLDLTGGIDYTV